MKILLLLVLKCIIYSKISGDRTYQSEILDVSSASLEFLKSDLEEYSKQRSLRVKRDLLIYEPSIFEPTGLERSPRRKRAELHKQNKIFFRRRKKKLFRKSRIRKSLMRRGKFTTSTPFRRNMKKYAAGKGKLARPPGLKYRKRYRFNKFKKTQDVALGVGANGMAPFKKSPPKKRPPIHVRDYERGRGTRKAFRGRVGERRSPVNADRKRAGAKGDRRKSSAKDGAPVKKSKEYYDDFSDYSNKLRADSLPKQTKSKKSYSTFGKTIKRKTVTTSLKIKDSEYAYSSEDNTLLLSDEDQLTDISSEIEALRSDISDERPRHRKNASSSEYEQYSYTDDDSAIVKGEVVSSKEESPESAPSAQKTTLLGPIKYEQYDIKKLESSMERVFKKTKSKKQNQVNLQYDDPFEDIEDAYKDETSYEVISDTEQGEQKVQKSKAQVKKRHEKFKSRSKKDQELKTKLSKAQTKTKPETDTEESYSYDEPEEYDNETISEKEQSTEVEGSGSNNETEEYYSDEYSSYEETTAPKRRVPTWKITQHSKQETFYEEYTDTDNDKTNSEQGLKSKKDVKATKGKITPKTKLSAKKSQETSTYESEEYDSEDLESSHKPDNKQKKTATTSKKVPKTMSAKIKSDSKKGHEISTYESEEYSHLESSHELDKKQKKTVMTSKKIPKTVSSGIKSDSKKGHETSAFESAEYESEEYSHSESSHELDNKLKTTVTTSKKVPKTASAKIKSDSKKGHETSTYESAEYESEEYSGSETSHELDNKQKNLVATSKKIPKTVSAKTKSDPKKSKDTSEFMTQCNESYDSEEYSDSDTLNKHLHSEQNIRKKDSLKLITKSKKLTSKITPKKEYKTSIYKSNDYDSQYSYENGKKTSVKSTKIPKQVVKKQPTKKNVPGDKMAAKKKSKSGKNQATMMYESDEYNSDYFGDHSGKQKEEDFGLIKSFGLDDIKNKKLSPSEEIEMKKYGLNVIKSEKNQKLPSIERMNTIAHGLDIFRAEHNEKLPPSGEHNLSSSDFGTSVHESEYDDSDYSHDDTDKSSEFKSFGMGDLKTSLSGKTTIEKETTNKIQISDQKFIKSKKNLAKQTTLKKSSSKTTKNKQTTKKSLETSYEESNYDSQVTSYEYSSDDVSHSKKSRSKHFKQITSIDRNLKHSISSKFVPKQKTTLKKGHENSYNELQDVDTKTNHTEDHPKEESLDSHYDETEPTKVSRNKTTSTTKRHKKGFTTLPSTPTKGFDSKEALLKVSSKAAALPKKHLFIYNTKKKTYELHRVDSLEPQGKIVRSATQSRKMISKNSRSRSFRFERTHHQLTLSLTSDHTTVNHSISNDTEVTRRIQRSNRKRSNGTGLKRSRKTNQPEFPLNANEKTT